ncbi:retron system putative HNH endonuclease [Kordia sp.]|uniref:retron system putative HNH endonuclease n=1 Tax=Kordia sp. TaxID=1965332 RepID=UPI003D2D445A
MIFIKRDSVEVPEILKDGSVKVQKELEKATAHYADASNTKAYKFSVYSHATIKQALIDMSFGKCAYCEGDILATYVGDIEHFRPKGEIEELKKDGNSKPGYYWLAADWNNLLFSCRNCNQKSKQETSENDEATSMGKMNQFPLADEQFRVRTIDGDLKKEDEVRLLIDPSVEDPEVYFKYDMNSGVIKPKAESEFKKERADTSIKVFALQRVPLVQRREKKALEISAQMQAIEDFMEIVDRFYDPEIAATHDLLDKLEVQIERLKNFLNPKEEYLGLAKQMIGQFMQKNFEVDINAA